MANNKIQFGLKNVHYAKITGYDSNGKPTYATPVPIPGAVNISMEAQGDSSKFYADNRAYYTQVTNDGYEGDLEVALIPNSMLVDIYGFDLDATTKVITEKNDAIDSEFALLFQFEGDKKNTLHCLYNCKSTRPQIAGATTTESTEPQTQTVTITASPLADGVVRRKTTEDTPDAVKNAWFTAVYVPETEVVSNQNPQ